MKPDWTHLERYRKPHPNGSTKEGDRFGYFEIPAKDRRDRAALTTLHVIATDGEHTDWQHVSIHVRYRDGIDLKMRTPTWDEMCYAKELFWSPDETVIQFHPAASNYVNIHPHVLHLWKHHAGNVTLPPTIFV